MLDPLLRHLDVSVETEERFERFSAEDLHRNSFVRSNEYTLLREFHSLSEEETAMRCQISNDLDQDIRIRSVSPFIYAGNWFAKEVLTVSRNALVVSYPAERAYGYDGPHPVEYNQPVTSFWWVSVHDPDNGFNFCMGILDPPVGLVCFSVVPLLSATEGKRVLRINCRINCLSGSRGVRVPAKSTLDLGAMSIAIWQGDHHGGMKRLTGRMKERLARQPRPVLTPGWCSWYTGGESEIAEEEIHKNLAGAGVIRDLKVFQIDDGWTTGNGTRDEHKIEVDPIKFPSGMEAMAKDIQQQNITPGLWLRPFEAWSSPAAPTWARGTLDLSHPHALAWLRGLASRVAVWGYEYLKVDFPTYDFFGRWGMELSEETAIPFAPYDDTLTNIQMYRSGLQALRDGFGEKGFIVGCNSLLGPATGIVDAMRIGDDVSAWSWERTLLMGVRSVAPLHFLNGDVWWNDPDCIVVHEPLSPQQAKLWASFVTFTGGMRVVSSRLYDLDPARLSALSDALDIPMGEAVPLDYPESNPPSLWLNRGESHALLGVFNFSDEPKQFEINRKMIGSQKFYSGIVTEKDNGQENVKLPPWTCKILELRDAFKPS